MTSEQSLAERLERAESWITAASSLHTTQLHERFLFLCIALNSLLTRRRYEGEKALLREDLEEFLKNILVLSKLDEDRGGTILKKAIQACRQDGAVLIRDRFLKDAYWRRSEASPSCSSGWSGRLSTRPPACSTATTARFCLSRSAASWSSETRSCMAAQRTGNVHMGARHLRAGSAS